MSFTQDPRYNAQAQQQQQQVRLRPRTRLSCSQRILQQQQSLDVSLIHSTDVVEASHAYPLRSLQVPAVIKSTATASSSRSTAPVSFTRHRQPRPGNQPKKASFGQQATSITQSRKPVQSSAHITAAPEASTQPAAREYIAQLIKEQTIIEESLAPTTSNMIFSSAEMRSNPSASSNSAPRTPTDGDYLVSAPFGMPILDTKQGEDLGELQLQGILLTSPCISATTFADDEDMLSFSPLSLPASLFAASPADSSCYPPSLEYADTVSSSLYDNTDILAASFLEDLDAFGVPVSGIISDMAKTAKLGEPLFSISPSSTHAPMSNAFQLFGSQSNSTLSPAGSPFDGALDDIPPMSTPALIPDGDFDMTAYSASTDSSPLWQSINASDISVAQNWQLFSQPTQSTDIPVTVTPTELALPLPTFADALVVPAQPAEHSRKRPSLAVETSEYAIQSSSKRSKSSASNEEATSAAITTATAALIAAVLPPSVPLPPLPPKGSGKYNGTRRTAIPLLDESAPIQARKYTGPPSKTSKRAVPAAAAKRVAVLQAHAEHTGVDTTEAIEDTIANRRLHNTLAARRSRQRKAEHLSILEARIAALEESLVRADAEKQVWMARAVDAGWSEKSRSTLLF